MDSRLARHSVFTNNIVCHHLFNNIRLTMCMSNLLKIIIIVSARNIKFIISTFHMSKQMVSLITVPLWKTYLLHTVAQIMMPFQKFAIKQMNTVGHTKQLPWAVTE